MYKINIKYNDKIIKDNKQFSASLDELKLTYDENISFENQTEVKFQIIFNNKIIYCLEDSFDSNLLIDNLVLNKINTCIENAIKLNNSKDISGIDDIWIDDF